MRTVMPPHKKPCFKHPYTVSKETTNLNNLFRERKVPEKKPGNTLIATWNIANLGDPQQLRRPKDHKLIAHILKRFDVVAVQEMKDDLAEFRKILNMTGKRYAAVFSDSAGNNERMAFVYDTRRIRTRELFAELALVERSRRTYKVPFKGKKLRFKGFNRNPYMVFFEAIRSGKKKSFGFTIVNVHLYYGAASGKKIRDRFLETMALAAWAKKRGKDPHTSKPRIILLGDMNLPATTKKHPMYKALLKNGLQLPRHASGIDWKGKRLGTNFKGDAPYDQIAFTPSKVKKFYKGRTEVFDFDNALFPELYEDRGIKDFRAYMKYYISDHRLFWGEFGA